MKVTQCYEVLDLDTDVVETLEENAIHYLCTRLDVLTHKATYYLMLAYSYEPFLISEEDYNQFADILTKNQKEHKIIQPINKDNCIEDYEVEKFFDKDSDTPHTPLSTDFDVRYVNQVVNWYTGDIKYSMVDFKQNELPISKCDFQTLHSLLNEKRNLDQNINVNISNIFHSNK